MTARQAVYPHALAATCIGFSNPRSERAVDDQIIVSNPAAKFTKKRRLPKVERKEMLTLIAEQARHFLEALGHSRVYWPVLIALATGMRRDEICAQE